MAAGYDGSIKFDTSIDSKGFNAGIAKLSSSMKGALSAITKGIATIGVVAAVVVVAVVAIIAAVVSAGIAIFAWAKDFTYTLYKTLDQTSAYRDQVTLLKNAFDTLQGSVTSLGTTLLTAIAPAIMAVINWLVKAINWVSMFIAALSGQKTVMQYVSGSTNEAANRTDRLAESTKKAGQAAKGALASFDQLNVLQMADTSSSDSGSSDSGGNVVLKSVPIDPAIMEAANKVKKFFLEDLPKFFSDSWQWIVKIWNIAWGWFKTNVIDPISSGFSSAWKWISQTASDAWNWIKTNIIDALVNQWNYAWSMNKQIIDTVLNWIKQTWLGLSTWFKTSVIDPLVNFWTPVFNFIGILANDAWVVIKFIWTTVALWFYTNVILPIGSYFKWEWDTISRLAKEAWDFIVNVWTIASGWYKKNIIDPIVNLFKIGLDFIGSYFKWEWDTIVSIWISASTWFKTNVSDPIKNSFQIALDWIDNKFRTIFTGIKDFVKGIINGLIGLINSMLRGAVSGINSLINSANNVGGKLPGWQYIPNVNAPQIPYLATGAVIPPNSQFAAILGDQKSGVNIESPLATMVEAFKQAAVDIGGDISITTPVYLDSEKIYEGQQKVSKRRGTSLVGATS